MFGPGARAWDAGKIYVHVSKMYFFPSSDTLVLDFPARLVYRIGGKSSCGIYSSFWRVVTGTGRRMLEIGSFHTAPESASKSTIGTTPCIGRYGQAPGCTLSIWIEVSDFISVTRELVTSRDQSRVDKLTQAPADIELASHTQLTLAEHSQTSP